MSELTKYNTVMPEWLKDNINKECPYCGAPIVDDGPSDVNGKMQLTQRYCPNVYCIGHMARKIVVLADYLKVPGYGPANAEAMIRLNGLKNHLEAIPILTEGVKPKVYLWEVGVLAQIYGMANKWKELLLGYKSFEEYFDKEPYILYGLNANRDYLIYAESFFELKEPLSKRVIYIMISGSINGFNNKHDFVPWLNDRVGKYFQIMEVGKRKTDVDFLVKEPYTQDHAKTGIALEAGIPIVSSREFIQIVLEMIKNAEELTP